MKQDKIDTIRKLIKKAQGTTNAHEAAAFMNKAQEMMAAEGVDMHTINLSEIGETRVRSKFSVSKINPAENVLMHAVADAFGCTLLWLAKKATETIDGVKYRYNDTWAEHILVGNKERLDLAAYAAEVLLRQLAKARQEFVAARSKTYWDKAYEDVEEWDWETRDAIKEACAKTIRKQLTKDGDSFALGWAFEIHKTVIKFALVDEERLLLQDYTSNVSGESKEKAVGELNMSYYKGVAAAKDASLYRPINDSGETAPLLGSTKLLGAK